MYGEGYDEMTWMRVRGRKEIEDEVRKTMERRKLDAMKTQEKERRAADNERESERRENRPSYGALQAEKLRD